AIDGAHLPAQYGGGPSQSRRRVLVKVTIAVNGAWDAAAFGSLDHDLSKQPSLERVNPHVAVPDRLRINQASDDDADTAERVPDGLVLVEQIVHRASPVAFDRSHEAGQRGSWRTRGAETVVVRLTRFRSRGIAEIDCAVLEHVRRDRRSANQHHARPPRLHRHPERVPTRGRSSRRWRYFTGRARSSSSPPLASNHCAVNQQKSAHTNPMIHPPITSVG